ncbi:MAG: hypothetical protein JXN65_11245 [Clostridia bacterium]|nr:hypothetical protein [Clostridia bacterium]
MKAKTSYRKNDGTTVVEYFKVSQPFEFRYNVLKNVLESEGEAVMFIDTNSRLKKPEKRIEAYFDENNVEYSIFKIPQREGKLFGMFVNVFRKPQVKLTEKYIISRITAETFSKEFFDEYLANYDIALGFGAKLGIGEMADDYGENVTELFFDKEFFENFIYDSIIFASARSSMDIRKIVAEYDG